MLVGQSFISGLVASVLIRPDTVGDAWIIAMPVAVLTLGASLVLSFFMPALDKGVVRMARWWRR
ncbi:hypothetical protein [Sphingomonas sp. Ant H11]|nr:hypothetical protein [Sphingomonas sp. Ant H11]